MSFKTNYFYFLLLFTTNALALDVAIIGAGASGISSAIALKKQGHRVVIFEKSDHVGGLVETQIIDGKKIELGAILVTPGYTEIKELAKSVNLTPVIWPSEVWIKALNGSIISFKDTLDLTSLTTARQALHFNSLLKNEDALGLPMLSPVENEQFLLPLSHFAHNMQVNSVLRSTVLPLTLSGYSFPDQIPALYAFKLGQRYGEFFAKAMFRHQILRQRFDYIPGINYFQEGFSELWKRLARNLDVRLNSEVTQVFQTRGSQGKKVALAVASGGAMLFDKVIVSTHPKEAQKFLHPSYSRFHELAAKIKTMRYRVSVIRTPSFFGAHKSFLFEKPISNSSGFNHVLGILNFFDDPHTFIAYQNLDETMSWENADNLLKNDLKTNLNIQHVEIIKQKEWGYFPHFPVGVLNNRVLEKIEHMQGQGDVYHVGAAWNFESTENASENGKYIVERYF